MEQEMKRLQLFFAAAQSDAAYQYGKHGIMEEVTREKAELQEFTAAGQLQQLGVDSVEKLYASFRKLFGCADWELEETENGFDAVAGHCLLCSIAKKQGAQKPCSLFCINPFRAYGKALGYSLDAKETLWDGNRCLFSHERI